MKNNLAFVFPGQGSQSIGMLADLAQEFPLVQDTFANASEILGYDLWQLTQSGPEEKLNQTEFTQPAMLAAGVAVWQVWQSGGAVPSFFAGHSLGEYTALVCAEALVFGDAVKLVAERGKYMQQAFAGQGAMVAVVGLQDDLISEICQQAAGSEILVPANYNSIGQVVLAGEMNAAMRAAELAKKAGAKIAKVLPVSVPSHSPLMKPAAELLAKRLEQVAINTPKIPVIHNADVRSHENDDDIRAALVKQLYSPVRWVETIQFMINNGIKDVLECGPGKVLTGLNKRISTEISVDFIGTPENMRKFL